MQFMKWVGVIAVLLLILSCFIPWVYIASGQITISGVESTGTNFGKPGYFHFLMAPLFLFFHLVPKVWAKRWNLLIVALNLAWAVRNFFIISACQGGECPEKKAGIYLVVLASVLMLVSALFPAIKLKEDKTKITEQEIT